MSIIRLYFVCAYRTALPVAKLWMGTYINISFNTPAGKGLGGGDLFYCQPRA